jgi:Spy/CpxP family protein refolding chaperone
MKTLSIMLIGVLFVWFGAAGGATAAPGPHGPGCGCGGKRGEALQGMIDDLKLDQATKAIVDQKVREAAQEATKLASDLEAARTVLHKLMTAATPDSAKVMQQVEQLGAIRTRWQKNRVSLVLALSGLLTPEQRQSLHHAWQERGADGVTGEGCGCGCGMSSGGGGAGSTGGCGCGSGAAEGCSCGSGKGQGGCGVGKAEGCTCPSCGMGHGKTTPPPSP